MLTLIFFSKLASNEAISKSFKFEEVSFGCRKDLKFTQSLPKIHRNECFEKIEWLSKLFLQ